MFLSPRAWSGHFWTVAPVVRHLISPPAPPAATHLRFDIEDPCFGSVQLSARLRDCGSDTLLLLVHGLGGAADSPYMERAAAAASGLGVSSLSLNLRGADGGGEDFYHAGLTRDLQLVCDDPRLVRFRQIVLLGFSLGGHLCLRFASEAMPSRVAAVAAVCPPIDLRAGADWLDGRPRWIYRTYILRSLKAMYAAVLQRRGLGSDALTVPFDQARRITTIREWDERIVSRRHGFSGAEEYWAAATVAGRLPRISRPTLVVSAPDDPMVHHDTVREHLESADNLDRVSVGVGGHVGFPDQTDLGLGLEGAVEEQVIGWLLARLESASSRISEVSRG